MQQRGDTTWRLHAFIGRDAGGRRRYATKTFHGTKRQASRALAAFVTEVSNRPTAVEGAEKSLDEVLEAWLDSRRLQLSPATTDRYRVAIKHIRPILGSVPIGRLRPHQIEDL